MNIHEYQAKALLHEFGVPISRGVGQKKISVIRGRPSREA